MEQWNRSNGIKGLGAFQLCPTFGHEKEAEQTQLTNPTPASVTHHIPYRPPFNPSPPHYVENPQNVNRAAGVRWQPRRYDGSQGIGAQSAWTPTPPTSPT
jgi:hypothetical protein